MQKSKILHVILPYVVEANLLDMETSYCVRFSASIDTSQVV